MRVFLFIVSVFIYVNGLGRHLTHDEWLVKKYPRFSVFYTSVDSADMQIYAPYFLNGLDDVERFFGVSFKNKFSIYIHPNRVSLDSVWQKDWGMPSFKSQCWMVASGVATKLDMISPKRWDSLACEHSYVDTLKTQKLIIHELVHVLHGQYGKSSDFSEINGIDWFVEGLATYVSGQCDSERMAEVKEAITQGNIPSSLANFWSGKLRYGLSGSVVIYIESEYGKDKLLELMAYSNLSEVLGALETNEANLVSGWKGYMRAQ